MEVGIFSHASNVAVRMTAAIGLSLVHPHLYMLISKMLAWLHTKQRLSKQHQHISFDTLRMLAAQPHRTVSMAVYLFYICSCGLSLLICYSNFILMISQFNVFKLMVRL